MTLLDPRAVRRTILDMLYRSQAAHLGSAMSVVEMLCAMYGCVDVAKIKERHPQRDRVVISKGHCAAAVYAVLHHAGLIDSDMLATYYRSGSPLTGLVNHLVPGVEHSTGSLGHGLGVSAGLAWALREDAPQATAYCLLGDSELHEGPNWEAFLFIAHHALTNLVTLVDDNNLGMVGQTSKVLNLRPWRDRFEGFGLRMVEVDGHDVGAINQAICEIRDTEGPPGVIVCRTIKSKGAPWENDVLSHYKNLTEETYKQAREALA